MAGTRGVLWDQLNRATARLYSGLSHSRVGRLMTGYRRADEALAKGRRYPGRHRCTPMSPGRLRVLSAVEGSLLFRVIHAFFHTLFCLPLGIYGLLLLVYGLCGVGSYFLLPYVYLPLAPSREHLVFSGVVAFLSIPLLLTRRTLAETLGRGGVAYAFFVGFLGLPRDRLKAQRHRVPILLPYLVPLFSVAAAWGALHLHPLFLLMLLLGLGVLGLILTYPEAGVVLSTAMLPVIWLSHSLLLPLCGVILLTWISYGLKLLFMHRTLRFGLLDTLVLLLGGVILLSGFTGANVTPASMLNAVLLFICLSDYFLIVNLMTTRGYIHRCLLGVGLSVVVVTLLAYLRILPVEALDWMKGSRASNAILGGAETFIERLSGLWLEHSELYLVLIFPWLYAYLGHTKRLLNRVLALVFIGLDLVLILKTHSISALFCILGVTVLFLLLMDHKGLSMGILLFPALLCGGGWVSRLFPLSEATRTVLSRSRHFKALLSESLWRMTLDHPGGIGMGEAAFTAVYPAYAAPDLGAVTDSGNLYFEVLLSYGWAGMLILTVTLLVFLQKGLTALRYATERQDRAVIIGGITGTAGLLIFGAVRSFITSPRVFFTMILVLALCSTYENLVFDESDVLAAQSADTPSKNDRLFRRG